MFNVLQVATCTTHMLLGLATKFSLHLPNVHAVGFSLGAHVAALSSNGLSVVNGSRLGRITGIGENGARLGLNIALCCNAYFVDTLLTVETVAAHLCASASISGVSVCWSKTPFQQQL
jgi:hypothetical protein